MEVSRARKTGRVFSTNMSQNTLLPARNAGNDASSHGANSRAAARKLSYVK
jgi:hypothetical protein